MGTLAAFPAPHPGTEDLGGGGHARGLGDKEREEGKRESRVHPGRADRRQPVQGARAAPSPRKLVTAFSIPKERQAYMSLVTEHETEGRNKERKL